MMISIYGNFLYVIEDDAWGYTGIVVRTKELDTFTMIVPPSETQQFILVHL